MLGIVAEEDRSGRMEMRECVSMQMEYLLGPSTVWRKNSCVVELSFLENAGRTWMIENETGDPLVMGEVGRSENF